MPLFLDTGHSERTARREAPRGACVELVPEGDRESGRGALFACAEGVPGRPDREKAARVAALALADGYYAAQDHEPREALAQSFAAAHRAVLSSGEAGRAAVVAAVVLHDRQWIAAYAGDVRVWRYHDHALKLLSRDHLLPRPAGRADVARACGLGTEVTPDYASGELAIGDILLITTPGVHENLDSALLRGILQADNHSALQMAEAITARALEAGADGYAGVCVARVEKLPSEAGVDRAADSSDLAFLEAPSPGMSVDGFRVEKLLHRDRRFRLYRAFDEENGRTVTLKLPEAGWGADADCERVFLREEWIGRRIDSPYLAKPLKLRPGRRRSLYTIMEYHEGENLARRIRRKGGLPLEETLLLADQLLAALEALHEHGVIHRDLRANHLLYDRSNRRLIVLGLGEERREVAAPGETERSTSAWSYRAPELFEGKAPDEQSDLYAAAVTLYRMITGEYPYGKVRTAASWPDREYRPIRQWKPDAPETLDEILRKGCAIAPKERYASAAQFAAALAKVASHASPPSPWPVESGSNRRHWTGWVAAAGLVLGLVSYMLMMRR